MRHGDDTIALIAARFVDTRYTLGLTRDLERGQLSAWAYSSERARLVGKPNLVDAFLGPLVGDTASSRWIGARLGLLIVFCVAAIAIFVARAFSAKPSGSVVLLFMAGTLLVELVILLREMTRKSTDV